METKSNTHLKVFLVLFFEFRLNIYIKMVEKKKVNYFNKDRKLKKKIKICFMNNKRRKLLSGKRFNIKKAIKKIYYLFIVINYELIILSKKII